MIVKIPINFNDGGTLVMLFGNSYKTWKEQFAEYVECYKSRLDSVGFAKKSTEKWVGYGGLKWCNEVCFQEILDEEAEGTKNRRRLFSQMKFEKCGKTDKEIDKILKNKL